MDELTSSPAVLVAAALIGFSVLLLLIIRFKLHAMISILAGAVVTGVIAGMPLSVIITCINEGIGCTLKGIALLVGLGSMLGAILEISGGAHTIELFLISRFGDKKAAWALDITGVIIAMAVLFNAGLVILLPLAFSLARRTRKSSLFYVIPLLAGLAVGYAFIPPTPGPVIVAAMLGVDLGWVIVIGAICGLAAMVLGGPVWGTICGRKYNIPAPQNLQEKELDESKLPRFSTVVLIILTPLVLILLKSALGIFPSAAEARALLNFLGEPFVALTIATLLAMLLLGIRNGYTMAEMEKIMTKSLEPTGLILLVTACGGVLRYILEYSGIGSILGNGIASLSLPITVVAFIIAAVTRISVGSSTVAMTMAAGIVSALPSVGACSPAYLACVTAAVAGGSTICSHFNDPGFWLVRSLVGMDDKTTLKTWTLMETIVGGSGALVAITISFFL